jgi:hypothetical protein
MTGTSSNNHHTIQVFEKYFILFLSQKAGSKNTDNGVVVGMLITSCQQLQR